jgi:hypothetical protein
VVESLYNISMGAYDYYSKWYVVDIIKHKHFFSRHLMIIYQLALACKQFNDHERIDNDIMDDSLISTIYHLYNWGKMTKKQQ